MSGIFSSKRDKGFDLPIGASEEAAKIHAAIMATLPHWAESGGCQVFHTPEEWAARGEEYGHGSVLVVVHDGGDHAPYFNWAYGAAQAREELNKAMDEIGFYANQCTGWYSAIYRQEAAQPRGE